MIAGEVVQPFDSPDPEESSERRADVTFKIHPGFYFPGGYDMAVSGWFHPEVECFDPTTGTWSVAPGLLMAGGLPGVVAVDSSIFIVGGKPNNGNTGPNTLTVEEYRPD